MPITDQTSGVVSVSGYLPTFHNPGWHLWTSGSTPYASAVHYDHPDSHYTHIISLGGVSIAVRAFSASYEWDTVLKEWHELGGSGSSIPGYPAAFSAPPDTAKPYKALARGFRVTRTVGATVDIAWAELNWSYYLEVAGGITDLANTGGSSFDLGYEITYDPIPLCQSVSEVTTPARAHATCVHQLRDNYWWQGDVEVTASCFGDTVDTVSYNSINLPQATFNMSWGEGGKWDHTTPPPPFPLQHYYERYSETWSLTYTLSSQYGDGFRATGSEDKVGHEDHSTYTFGDGYMTGTVTGNTAQDEEYDGGWTENEFVQAETSFSIALQAFDQMTEISDLKATVTHFIDQTMDWDSGDQKYVQSATYSDQTELAIPGTYSMSFQRTSRYEDRAVPASEDEFLQATLTSASLAAFDLPSADNKMTLHDRALNAVGINTSDWGAFDEHGGSYSGLVCIWVQSPLSVQWAQDDRGSAAPPSWWYNTHTLIPLDREATIEAVIDFGGGESFPVKRDLVWHPTRRDEQWYGEVKPGVAETDLWKHIGDWHRISATKHLLAGTVVGGPFNMTAGNVTCDEDDPVDHTAYGVMPSSEDVTDWRAYRWLKIILASTSPSSWTLTCQIDFEYDEVTDNYMANTEDRRDGFSCETHTGTAIFSATIPSSGAKEALFDLMEANAPNLERVTSITLSGFPGGYIESAITDVQLLAPTADVWVESTDQRPVMYGGEPRYTCGSDPEYLGIAKTPEEYGGWWAVGGHMIVTGVRDPGRTVDVAPAWGMPFVIRRVTDCGALQDELMDFSAWHGQRVGDWGLEGFYGQLHNELTDTAMADWVDSDNSALGCATGTGWITHIPILYHYPVGSQNLLSSGRAQDGATDLPVIVRAGGLRLAGGIGWAHSPSGDAPIWGFKSILYGARIEHVSSGSWRLTRAEPAQSCILYEREVDVDTRVVDTRNTDADGRLRFERGVNEFRHAEYGIDEEDCPDYTDRSDYLSDITIPGESPADLVFGLQHYQVIPTTSRSSLVTPSVVESCVLRTYEDTIIRANCGEDVGMDPGDDVIISRIGEGGIPSTRTILLNGAASVPTLSPNLFQLADGRVIFVYSQEQNTYSRTIERHWVEEEFTGGDDVMIDGVYLPSIYADNKNGVVHCVGYDGTNLVYHRGSVDVVAETITWEDGFTIEAADEQRGDIILLPDGSLLCTYVDAGGNEKERVSRDHGETWEDW